MYFLDNCGALELASVQTFRTAQAEICVSDGEHGDAQLDFKTETCWSRAQTGIFQNKPK